VTDRPPTTSPPRGSAVIAGGGRPRVAVVRMLPGLGDLLCAVPALRAIRAAEPSAHVTFIGLPSGQWLADRFPHYIDRWLPCATCPGLPESEPDALAHQRFLREARAAHFDLAIQLHGDGRVTNAFTAALGARRWGGLRRHDDERRSDGLLTALRPERHEVDRCRDAVRAVGFAGDRCHLEFPVTASDEAELAALLGVRPATLAVVHAGASRPDRRWAAPSFAAIADHLATRVDTVVLTGSASEADVVGAVAAHAAIPPRDLAGRTPVGVLAALVAAARIVVCNDTGVAHLAGAVGTPTVTVFARSDRPRWAVRGAGHRGVGGLDGRWPAVPAVVDAVEDVLAGPGDDA
jgi:ADP-heptose:LPS heptosyltransferase